MTRKIVGARNSYLSISVRFIIADYETDADALIVERAGRDLYLVAPTGD